jgi:hypothetical protein
MQDFKVVCTLCYADMKIIHKQEDGETERHFYSCCACMERSVLLIYPLKGGVNDEKSGDKKES